MKRQITPYPKNILEVSSINGASLVIFKLFNWEAVNSSILHTGLSTDISAN